MKNEVYVPLPHSVAAGDIILDSQFADNQALFNELKSFCGENLSGEYDLDRTVYARGIRVLLEDDHDVERLHQWMDL